MECGLGGQPHETPHFHPRHRQPAPRNDPPKKCLGPSWPPSHRCRTFPLLLVQIGYGLLCGLWVWSRITNCQPCCPPMSNPSTSPWTAWPDGSGRWDSWMAAQHLPRDLARPSSVFNNSLKTSGRSERAITAFQQKPLLNCYCWTPVHSDNSCMKPQTTWKNSKHISRLALDALKEKKALLTYCLLLSSITEI